MSMSISSSSLDPSKVAVTASADPAAASSTSASESIPASGLSSTGSSMSSAAAPVESQGFIAAVSAWVSYVIDGIRGCLAKLPLIGRFFASADASSSSSDSVSSTSGSSSTLTNAQLLDMVRTTFVQDPAAVAPLEDAIVYALDAVRNMTGSLEQMQAYFAVITASNSTDDIAKRFLAVLPKDVQNGYKGKIWEFNKGDDLSASGLTGNTLPVGDVVTSGALIRSALAQQAAQDYINVLVAAAAPAVSSSAVSSSAPDTSSATSTTV